MAIMEIVPVALTTRAGYRVEITAINLAGPFFVGWMTVPPFAATRRSWRKDGQCQGDVEDACIDDTEGVLGRMADRCARLMTAAGE